MSVSEVPWPGESELFGVGWRLATAGRLPHAWLVVGMAGLPASPYADLLATLFLCERPGKEGPCLTCPSCRRARDEIHPDFTIVRPDGLGIRVDAVRAALARIQFRSESDGRRVVRLDAADRLGPEAAAALLKGIEEPHEGTVFVLSADVPGRVPATVRSRCITVSLRPVRRQVLAEWLLQRGFDEERATALAEEADGAPGRLMTLLGAAPALLPETGGVPMDETVGRSVEVGEAAHGETAHGEGGAQPDGTLADTRRKLGAALRRGAISGHEARARFEELELALEALQRGVPGKTVLDAVSMIHV